MCNSKLCHGRNNKSTPLRFQPIKLLYIKGAKSSEKCRVFYIMKGTIFGGMLDDDDDDDDDDAQNRSIPSGINGHL